jgi:hypothetical protein
MERGTIVVGVTLCVALLATLVGSQTGFAKSTHRPHANGAARPQYHLPSSGTLTAADLAAFALEKANAPSDQFSEPFDETPIIGRQFRVVIRPSLFGPLRASYDVEAKQLHVSVHGYEPFAMDFLRDDPQEATDFFGLHHGLVGVLVSGTAKHVANKLEQNAFGATAEVDEWYGDQVFIASDDPQSENPASFATNLDLEPAAARAVAESMSLVIEGQVTAYAPHHALFCGGYLNEATLSHPTQSMGQHCLISVKVSGGTLQDGAGKVLKTF